MESDSLVHLYGNAIKMNPSYSIQKPCTEDWGKMNPESAGEADRHCQVCCKTVIDFSKKSNTEIIGFLQINSEKKICGRFRSEQLNGNRQEKPAKNRYRVFMAALYLVFGGLLFTSCRTKEHSHKMGKVKIENSFTGQNNFNRLDTPSSRERFKTDQPKKDVPVCIQPEIAATDTSEPQIMMLGEVMYIPEDSTK